MCRVIVNSLSRVKKLSFWLDYFWAGKDAHFLTVVFLDRGCLYPKEEILMLKGFQKILVLARCSSACR